MRAATSLSFAACLGLSFASTPALQAQDRAKESAERFIAAVRTYADNVLTFGGDHYGPVPTPLFVDGLDVDTHEPIKWKSVDGHEWVISNFALQQSLLRTLDGLSTLTGDARYRRAAVETTRYALLHLDREGLLAWGGHMAYNATDARFEYAADKGPVHELKSNYPYYAFFWQVDPARTKTLMENIWRGHILDWSKLDFNRHAHSVPPGKLWDHEYVGGPVFFWGKGLTFHNAGSDLYYDAAMLAKLSGDDQPLVWGKRLAHRYVETRDPKTGLGGVQYSQDAGGMYFDPENPDGHGDRAAYFYGDDFPGHVVLESTLFPAYGDAPGVAERICQMDIADELGDKGREFGQWAHEELTAWGKVAFRKSDCSFIPMLTDGTSMEGYVLKKGTYFGPKGHVLKAGKAKPQHFWVYAMAFRQTHDPFMWEMAREIALGNQLGDIGATPDAPPAVLNNGRPDTDTLLGFLELYRATHAAEFLKAAEQVGDAILKVQFNNGFFVRKDGRFASFDRVEPLALLHLAAAMEGRPETVPPYPGSAGFFFAAYGNMGGLGEEYFFNMRRQPEKAQK